MKRLIASLNTKRTSARAAVAAWFGRLGDWTNRQSRAAAALSNSLRHRWRQLNAPAFLPSLRTHHLLFLAVVLVGSGAAVLCWHGAAPDSAENDLLAADFSSKLEDSKEPILVEATPEAAAPPAVVIVAKPIDTDPAPVAVVVPLAVELPPIPPLPAAPQPAAVELPNLSVPLEIALPPISEPAAFDDYAHLHRGETPMIQTWKTLGWQTVLTMALATPAVLADDPVPGKIDDKKTTELLRKLEALQKAVDDMKTAVTADSKTLKDENDKRDLRIQNSAADVKDLKDQLQNLRADLGEQIKQLKGDLEKLRTSTGPTTTRALYQTAQPSGRIRLVNNYPTQMSIVVNGQSYRVLPNETRDLDGVPVGSFTYQVLGAQDQLQYRSLNPSDTFTIRVHVQ